VCLLRSTPRHPRLVLPTALPARSRRSPEVRARWSALRQLADIETTHRAHLSHARTRVCDTHFHHRTVGNHTFAYYSLPIPGTPANGDRRPTSLYIQSDTGTKTNPLFSVQSKTLRGTGLPLNARRDVNALALGVTSTFPAARTDRPGAQRFNSRHIKSISVQVARRILRIWMKPPNSLLFR
jgi:hypothetical protein